MTMMLSLSMALGAQMVAPADEAETTALVARFTTPPTSARKTLINTCIKALKTAGVWDKLDALYLFAAADSQAALLNWKGATFNATLTGTTTFTADQGFAGNGSNGAVDSNFNPTTASSPKFVQDSAYFGIWVRTNVQNSVTPAGYFNGTQGVTINPRSTGNDIAIRINQAATFSTAGGLQTNAIGLTGATRTGASAVRIGKNGVKLSDGTTTSAALANGTLKFGTIGNSTWSTNQFAGGFIGSALTEADELALYNAIAAYMTGVGA